MSYSTSRSRSRSRTRRSEGAPAAAVAYALPQSFTADQRAAYDVLRDALEQELDAMRRDWKLQEAVLKQLPDIDKDALDQLSRSERRQEMNVERNNATLSETNQRMDEDDLEQLATAPAYSAMSKKIESDIEAQRDMEHQVSLAVLLYLPLDELAIALRGLRPFIDRGSSFRHSKSFANRLYFILAQDYLKRADLRELGDIWLHKF